MQENDEIDIKGALAYLRIGRSTLYRLMDEGKISPVNDSPLLSRPRRLLFRRSDLERLLQSAREDKEAHSRRIA